MSTLLGLYSLPYIFVSKSSLIPLKGTLNFAKTYITTVEDRKGNKSRKSELIFSLKEYNKVYSIGENIGTDYRDDNHEKIAQKLNQASLVTVWIKKSEINSSEPEVFQIDGPDDLIILSIAEVKNTKRFIITFSLIFGLVCIKVFFWMRFPEKMRSIFLSKN
ncbi:hypothetical protein H8B13_10845 [Hymenobacter sp. BT188]|nr:hypothetical protein [Hymenobacter sp. BT188]